LRTGIVTAKENSTGRMFEFKVTDEKLLQSLKVGEAVYANFASGQVSVDGVHPCCKIVSLDPQPPVKDNQGGTPNPVPACCGITAIDMQSGLVSAEEKATHRSFQFEVSSVPLRESLKIGQGVYANFTSLQVSLDGKNVCCKIVNVQSASAGTTVQKDSAPGSSPTSTPTPGARTTKPTKPTTADPKATGTPTVKPNENDTSGAIRGQAAPAPPPGTAAPGAPAGGTPQGRPVPTLPVFSHEKAQVRILSQGKKWRLQTVTGTVEGRPVKEEALYHIVGKEGISESPIPPQINWA